MEFIEHKIESTGAGCHSRTITVECALGDYIELNIESMYPSKTFPDFSGTISLEAAEELMMTLDLFLSDGEEECPCPVCGSQDEEE